MDCSITYSLLKRVHGIDFGIGFHDDAKTTMAALILDGVVRIANARF